MDIFALSLVASTLVILGIRYHFRTVRVTPRYEDEFFDDLLGGLRPWSRHDDPQRDALIARLKQGNQAIGDRFKTELVSLDPTRFSDRQRIAELEANRTRAWRTFVDELEFEHGLSAVAGALYHSGLRR